MLNLKKEAFEEAIKGLELSLKSNYQRGKGPTSKIGAAITALLEKIRSPAEQDRLVPNALFALAALRQNHNVNMEGDLPAGYKSVKNPIPVPQNTAAVVAEVEAAEYEDDEEEEDEVDEENAEATAPAIATPPPGPAGVGAPAPRSGQSLPLRPATGRPREPEEEKEEEGPGEEEEKAGAPATATPTLPPAEAGTRTKGSSGSLPIRAATGKSSIVLLVRGEDGKIADRRPITQQSYKRLDLLLQRTWLLLPLVLLGLLLLKQEQKLWRTICSRPVGVSRHKYESDHGTLLGASRNEWTFS